MFNTFCRVLITVCVLATPTIAEPPHSIQNPTGPVPATGNATAPAADPMAAKFESTKKLFENSGMQMEDLMPMMKEMMNKEYGFELSCIEQNDEGKYRSYSAFINLMNITPEVGTKQEVAYLQEVTPEQWKTLTSTEKKSKEYQQMIETLGTEARSKAAAEMKDDSGKEPYHYSVANFMMEGRVSPVSASRWAYTYGDGANIGSQKVQIVRSSHGYLRFHIQHFGLTDSVLRNAYCEIPGQQPKINLVTAEGSFKIANSADEGRVTVPANTQFKTAIDHPQGQIATTITQFNPERVTVNGTALGKPVSLTLTSQSVESGKLTGQLGQQKIEQDFKTVPPPTSTPRLFPTPGTVQTWSGTFPGEKAPRTWKSMVENGVLKVVDASNGKVLANMALSKDDAARMTASPMALATGTMALMVPYQLANEHSASYFSEEEANDRIAVFTKMTSNRDEQMYSFLEANPHRFSPSQAVRFAQEATRYASRDDLLVRYANHNIERLNSPNTIAALVDGAASSGKSRVLTAYVNRHGHQLGADKAIHLIEKAETYSTQGALYRAYANKNLSKLTPNEILSIAREVPSYDDKDYILYNYFATNTKKLSAGEITGLASEASTYRTKHQILVEFARGNSTRLSVKELTDLANEGSGSSAQEILAIAAKK